MDAVNQTTNPLDRLVGELWKSLAADSVPRPDVLVNLATGLDLLPERLSDGREIRLGDHAELPDDLASTRLFCGTLHAHPSASDAAAGTSTWVVSDNSLEPRVPGAAPAWHGLLPIWLASKAGAGFMLHASAGHALARGDSKGLAPGGLALLRDHVNFGAASPLSGLGESELGPLFPDTTHLHDTSIRELALRMARERGLTAGEAIAACVPAPHLDTPAECAFYAKAGADLVVQGLAAPLIAAAHAGLRVLSVCAVLDGPERELDVRAMLEQAELTAPALEELLLAVCRELPASSLLEDGF